MPSTFAHGHQQATQRPTSWGRLRLLMLGAALALAAFAPSASALQAFDATTHTALPVGSTINGHSTNTTWTMSFFGVGTSLSCSTSALVGTVKSNDGTTLAISTDSFILTGCINEANGSACSLVATGLPWNPLSPAGNGGGMIAGSTTSVSWGTGSGGIQMSGSNCVAGGNTCVWQGGTTGPLTAPGASITNYMTGTWSNTTSSLTFSAAAIKSSACGAGTWTGSYTLRTGGTVGSGNAISIS